MSELTDTEKHVVGSYAETLETVKTILAAKIGAFDGERNWNAHAQGIHALVEVDSFINSAIEHLNIKAGLEEPELRMPDGSPMPEALKQAIQNGNVPVKPEIDSGEDGVPQGSYL